MCVKFMKRGRGKNAKGSFKWPEREDILWVKKEDILCVIEPPLQTSKTRKTLQLFSATIDVTEEIGFNSLPIKFSQLVGNLIYLYLRYHLSRKFQGVTKC